MAEWSNLSLRHALTNSGELRLASQSFVAGPDFRQVSRAVTKRMIMFLQTVIADLEKPNDSQGDTIVAHEAPAACERRNTRARRSIAKPAPMRRRRRTRRVSVWRRAQRATRAGRARQSRF
jgi:hypothetical protein